MKKIQIETEKIYVTCSTWWLWGHFAASCLDYFESHMLINVIIFFATLCYVVDFSNTDFENGRNINKLEPKT